MAPSQSSHVVSSAGDKETSFCAWALWRLTGVIWIIQILQHHVCGPHTIAHRSIKDVFVSAVDGNINGHVINFTNPSMLVLVKLDYFCNSGIRPEAHVFLWQKYFFCIFFYFSYNMILRTTCLHSLSVLLHYYCMCFCDSNYIYPIHPSSMSVGVSILQWNTAL